MVYFLVVVVDVVVVVTYLVVVVVVVEVDVDVDVSYDCDVLVVPIWIQKIFMLRENVTRHLKYRLLINPNTF